MASWRVRLTWLDCKLKKNNKRKILKLTILSCGNNNAFSCRLLNAN